MQATAKTAAALCRDNNTKIMVFSMEDPDNIVKIVILGNLGFKESRIHLIGLQLFHVTDKVKQAFQSRFLIILGMLQEGGQVLPSFLAMGHG